MFRSAFEAVTFWAPEGSILTFLWVALGGVAVWLLSLLGHYAAEMAKDADGNVNVYVETTNLTGYKQEVRAVAKQHLQAEYRIVRIAALIAAGIGCLGMTVSAFKAII